MPVTQWVNLPRDAKWVGGEVTSIDRTGPVHFTLEWKNDAVARVRYWVEVGADPAVYALSEEHRNQAFQMRGGEGAAIFLGDGTLEESVQLPAAGGNEYTIKADHDGTVVSTPVIAARRMLFYQSIDMTDVPALDLGATRDEYWNPDKKYYIKLVEEQAGQSIPFMKVIQAKDKSTFKSAASGKRKLKARDPLCFYVVAASSFCDKKETIIKQQAGASAESRLWQWSPGERSLTIEVGEYLWHGLDAGDDAEKAWFVKLGCVLKCADGKSISIPNGVTSAMVSLPDAPDFEHGGHHRIKVDLSTLAPEGDVTDVVFILKVNTAGGFALGFSAHLRSMISVADRASWQTRTADQKTQALIHEIAHMLGMVADGLVRRPDKPASYYENQSHNGSHCSTGATYADSAWSGTPGCVMFGADGIRSGQDIRATPTAFCATCEELVRKLDLGDLW